jgi:hypothetical protein
MSFARPAVRNRIVPCLPKVASVVVVLGVVIAWLGAITTARGGEFLDDRLGKRTVPILLLLRPDVQADLNLEPVQVAESYRAAANLYQKAMTLRGKTGPALVAARRAIDWEESVWLSRHLSEMQLARLGQIDLQWEGIAAMLSRPVVADHLQLAIEQKRSLAHQIAQLTLPRASQRLWTPADHENLARQALAVLSDKQREAWKSLLGPTCRFVLSAAPAPASALAPAPAVPAYSAAASSIDRVVR